MCCHLLFEGHPPHPNPISVDPCFSKSAVALKAAAPQNQLPHVPQALTAAPTVTLRVSGGPETSKKWPKHKHQTLVYLDAVLDGWLVQPIPKTFVKVGP